MKKAALRVTLGILLAPIVLAGLIVLWQLLGMAVNRAATAIRTDRFAASLVECVADIEILSRESITGNTGGTGNHVDCLSRVTFSTALDAQALKNALAARYDFDGFGFRLHDHGDGTFTAEYITRAPFADNIAGH